MLNGTDGGEGGRWTEEAKAKASKTHTEMWQDPEYRENHIAAYGDRSQHAPYPDDFGVNASRINKERWADPEYRERMCEAFQNRAKKTHCSRGHEYNEENTYTDPDTGWRHCRICRREDQNRKYAEMRAANPLPPREHVTRCAQGHEYTEENTYVDPKTGDRHCRICRRAYDNKRYAQKTMQAGEDTSGLKGNDSL